MKKILTIIFATVILPFCLSAQNAPGDKIVGLYLNGYHNQESKIKIFKEADGTYTAQVCWVKNRSDDRGEVYRDEKNPDKSKRNVPCDEIVLMKGLKYNAEKDTWGDTKIYDPVRGIKANATCSFSKPNELKIRGAIMGIGETVYWKKLE